MEKIKQRLSDVAHSWTSIAVALLFLFGVQPGPDTSLALEANGESHREKLLIAKNEKQLKKETLERYSNAVYKPSEMLTDKELKELLWAVGFEGKALKTAWAVAKSESNGRPMAYNGNRKTGDSSYGIFQINMLGNLGIDRKEKFELRSNVLLFDPVINAEITYHMTQGGNNWSSWSSMKNGAVDKRLADFPNQ
jgi:hypothetical protein